MVINPNFVLSLKSTAQAFFCKQEDNIYNIKFLNFKVRDFINNEILFNIDNEEE